MYKDFTYNHGSKMSRLRIITKREGVMYEKASVLALGAAVIAGISIEKIGGAALLFSVGSLVMIAVAILFIWFRVSQLSEETNKLSNGISELNTKVEGLERTMSPIEADRR